MISATYKIFFFSFSLVLCLYYIILITAEGNTINSGRVLRLRVLTYLYHHFSCQNIWSKSSQIFEKQMIYIKAFLKCQKNYSQKCGHKKSKNHGKNQLKQFFKVYENEPKKAKSSQIAKVTWYYMFYQIIWKLSQMATNFQIWQNCIILF